MDAVTLDPARDAASKLDKLKTVAAELHEIGAQIQVLQLSPHFHLFTHSIYLQVIAWQMDQHSLL